VSEWSVVHDDARLAIGRRGPVIVSVLRATIDESVFDHLDGLLGDVDGAGDVWLLLVRAGRSPSAMSRGATARARAVLGAHEGRLRGVAYVNAGSGLKAKLLRGAMNAVLKAAPFEARVTTDVGEALRWLAGTGADVDGLDAHVAALS